MSEEYTRRGRNWFTAIGVLFIIVAGDSKESVEVVNGLINEIEGLRPIYLGPGTLAYLVEMCTPLLLNAMIRNKMKNPGIKIV